MFCHGHRPPQDTSDYGELSDDQQYMYTMVSVKIADLHFRRSIEGTPEKHRNPLFAHVVYTDKPKTCL